MQGDEVMSRRIVFALVVATLALEGCYSYRGGAVPVVDPTTIASPDRERDVTYRLRVESNVGDDDKISDIAVTQLVRSLQTAGAEVRPFGQMRDPDVDLVVEVEVEGSISAQMLSGFVSGFTFLLFPGYAGLDFTTEGVAVGPNGTEHKYRYRDSTSTWIQLFLLLFTNSHEGVVEDLIGDMMRSLARDMQRDGLLPAPIPEALPAGD